MSWNWKLTIISKENLILVSNVPHPDQLIVSNLHAHFLQEQFLQIFISIKSNWLIDWNIKSLIFWNIQLWILFMFDVILMVEIEIKVSYPTLNKNTFKMLLLINLRLLNAHFIFQISTKWKWNFLGRICLWD